MSQVTFADVKHEIGQVLFERDREIYLSLVAIVAREHLFMLGPPGTGKTALAGMWGRAIPGGFFEILLSKFTEPSEVFGPLSVKGLMERDEYRRNTAGYMPDCRISMLDEIWKASSAILNSLLTILNERQFDNGGIRETTRVGTVFGASNEMPADASLGAIYDRFMLRCEVAPVTDSMKLLSIPTAKIPQISEEYLLQMQQAADNVHVSSDVHRALVFIRETLKTRGITISDRRFRKSIGLIQASAAIAHRQVAAPQDLKILAYCFWVTPDQAPMVKLVVEDVVKQFQQQVGVVPDIAPVNNPTLAAVTPAPVRSTSLVPAGPAFQSPTLPGSAAPGIPVGSRGNPNRLKPKHVPQYTPEQLRAMGQAGQPVPAAYTQVGSPPSQSVQAPQPARFTPPSLPVPAAPSATSSKVPNASKPTKNFSGYTKEELNQWIIRRMCSISATEMATDTDLGAAIEDAQARIARDPSAYSIPERNTIENALKGIADARRREGI